MTLDVSVADLVQIIGRKEVELQIVQAQLEKALTKIKELEAPVEKKG